jgi:hypothetical protein
MGHDAAWHARITRVISGALRVWGITGAVHRDPDAADGFVVIADGRPATRLRHAGLHQDAAVGWTVARLDPESGVQVPVARHAGLPGLLQQLREDLAPDAPAGRLVIGAQPLLGRDPADARR